MVYVDFCKGQNGLWIGCAEHNNGRYFATGRTLDILMKNIKTGGGRIFKISGLSFMLSSRQMEIGEFEAKHIKYASSTFKTRFWYERKEKEEKPKKDKNNRKKIIVDGVLYNSISEAETKLNIKQDTIGQALRAGRGYAMGHVIAYANNLPQFAKPKEKEIKEVKEEKKTNDIKYYYEEKDGILYVYERKLIAKYEVENK